jgi:hypothetical protein
MTADASNNTRHHGALHLIPRLTDSLREEVVGTYIGVLDTFSLGPIKKMSD